MAENKAPKYSTMGLLFLLERLKQMPKGRKAINVHKRARKYLGGK